jgi:hypothetical protein
VPALVEAATLLVVPPVPLLLEESPPSHAASKDGAAIMAVTLMSVRKTCLIEAPPGITYGVYDGRNRALVV